MNKNALLDAFIRTFFHPSARRRVLSLIETPRGQERFRRGLDHVDPDDLIHANLLAPSQQNPDEILRLLKEWTKSDLCLLVSTNSKLNFLEMSLGDALDATVGSGFGTLVIPTPFSYLAYYESEELGTRYILRRPPTS